MSKKNKSKAELERELRELKRSRLAFAITEIVLNLTKFGTIALCFYWGSQALTAMAGKTTAADIGISILGNLTVSETVAWLFGLGGTLYGYAQRRQRQKIVKSKQDRITKLEKMIDPKRTSSNLTDNGDTSPLDM